MWPHILGHIQVNWAESDQAQCSRSLLYMYGALVEFSGRRKFPEISGRDINGAARVYKFYPCQGEFRWEKRFDLSFDNRYKVVRLRYFRLLHWNISSLNFCLLTYDSAVYWIEVYPIKRIFLFKISVNFFQQEFLSI